MTIDGVNDQALFPNTWDEEAGGGYLTPTSTGFKLTTQSDRVNNNSTYIYMALRRADGYVGKPPSLGTDVFAMDAGSGGATVPTFESGFPVDFAFFKEIDAVNNWYMGARLMGPENMYMDATNAESGWPSLVYDYQNGILNTNTVTSSYQGWIFKRHAGFDVVTYTGMADTSGNVEIQHVPHSLGKTPEMMWVKRRDSGLGTPSWFVYHKGSNGGSSPQN